MKNTAIIVFKKELARFFGDKRLMFTTVLLPGLIIFLMYSIMGEAMNASFNSEDKVFDIAVVNMPAIMESGFPEKKFNVKKIDRIDENIVREKISNKDYQLCIVFPENFEEALSTFRGTAAENTPNVEIFYNSSDIQSSNAYSTVVALLSAVEENVSNVFNINHLDSPDDENIYDVATDEEASGLVFAMVLPMVLMTMMYSSCMAFSVESIAGEKERGTIASLLITPTPRNQLILGKVLALSVMALLGGSSSFLGTLLSMPNLLGNMEDAVGGISAQYYKVSDYLWLVLIIITTIILFVAAISILSTTAKTVKEASSLVMPLMIVVMLVSFSTMYSTEAKTEIYWYLIPVYNSVQSMMGIFLFKASAMNMLLTAAVNIALSGVCVFVLTKMFNSEKIMFNR